MGISLLMIASLLVTSVECTVYPICRRKVVRAGIVYVQESPPALIVEIHHPDRVLKLSGLAGIGVGQEENTFG